MNNCAPAANVCRRVLASRRNTFVINSLLIVGASLLALLLVGFATIRFTSLESDALHTLDAGYLIGWMIGGGLLSASIVLFILRRVGKISANRSSLQWAPFAVYGDSTKVIEQTIQELERNGSSVGRLCLTKNLLVDPEPLNIWFYEDLIWVFYDAEQEDLVIKCEKQDNARIDIAEREGKTIVQELKNRAPWIHAGFTSELAELWKKSSRKFSEQVVEKRRAIVHCKQI